jgi:beta-glucanase (GH16 family)
MRIALLLLLSMTLIMCNQPDAEARGKGSPDSLWTLVWQDEFEGDGEVDPGKWEQPEYNRRPNPEGPDGWWLKEDSYLDGTGNLVIRARRINNRNNDNDPYDYSTGAVRSLGRFEQRYGKFEARCQMPEHAGWWVAFWLFSSSVFNEDGSGEDGTEIDIMEGFGWNEIIHHNLHWDGYGNAHRSAGFNQPIAGISEGFHTFTLEWSEAEYIFFVDGIETWRSAAGGVSKVPAYVKLTGELSTLPGLSGEYWANDPATGFFPDHFLVDYVRVWSRSSD